MTHLWPFFVVLLAVVIFLEAFYAPRRQRSRGTSIVLLILGAGLVAGLIADTPWPLMSGLIGLLGGNFLTVAGYGLGRLRHEGEP